MIDLVMLSFSFTAGVQAFFNPCGFAMLPAYVSYALGQGRHVRGDWLESGLRGLSLGAAVSAGFFTVFGGLGLIFSLIGSTVKSEIEPLLPWLAVLIGVALITMGVLMLLGKGSAFPSLAGSLERLATHLGPHRPLNSDNIQPQERWLVFYLFGVSYAIASCGCAIPIFMAVVTQALTVGFLNGLTQFLAYAWGMSLLMLALSLIMALARDTVYSHLAPLVTFVQKMSALVMIGAGGYLVWYQLIYARLLNL